MKLPFEKVRQLMRDRDQIRIVFGQLQSAGVHFIHGQKMVVGRDFVD